MSAEQGIKQREDCRHERPIVNSAERRESMSVVERTALKEETYVCDGMDWYVVYDLD